MNATEIRDQNWQTLRQRLHRDCMRVLDAWRCWGPCTTRRLAVLANMELLNVRPRTTDLKALNLVECCDRERGEGVYRAVSEVEAQRVWEEAHDGRPKQMDLC